MRDGGIDGSLGVVVHTACYVIEIGTLLHYVVEACDARTQHEARHKKTRVSTEIIEELGVLSAVQLVFQSLKIHI